jgi:RNA polymerase sigma-70 factor, ECF subfamily
MDELTDLSDQIQAAIAGDATAVACVLLAYRPRLLDYIERKLPNELRRIIDPQDVLQDTQFRAARRIGSFRSDGDDAFYRWLVTISRNRMLQLLEMSQTQKRGGGETRGDSIEVLLEDLAVSHRTPSRSAAGHELVRVVEACIEQLPSDHAEVIRLRYIEGLSVADVAERMARTGAAVTMLCQRAAKTLREKLRSKSRFL